jgi:hypothetical protein
MTKVAAAIRVSAIILAAAIISLGCARVAVHMQPGQTEEIATRAHTVCFDETHSYARQAGLSALFGPMIYVEKARQNRAYVECMADRGFVTSYHEGMGYHPDLTIEAAR